MIMESGSTSRGPREPPGENSRRPTTTHSAADLQVLREIDHVYFSDPRDFDAGRYVLERAPCPATSQLIEEIFSKLKRQEQVVSGKALHLISQQRDNCDREFYEIQNTGESVAGALDTCRESRTHLRIASTRLTVSSFAILANFRKRQLVRSVLKSLDLLQTLRRVELDVADRMSERDYEGAVALILKCRKAASTHNEYVCVSALANRLQDTLEMTEERLDSVLSSICKSFDEETFSRLRRSYALLDKLQVAMEQLHMHYISAIHESALEAVRPFAVNMEAEMKLQSLCQGVPTANGPGCLLNLCEKLWNIMKSYYSLVDWHNHHDNEELPTSESARVTREFEQNVSKEYIRQKLKAGLMRVWHDVQSRVSTFLSLSRLEYYPFEKFVLMLGILRKLTQVAEVFCGDSSEDLQDFIKTHSVAYLRNYHRGRMEELKLFLENEGWEQCPVKSSFNLLNLQEFKTMKRYLAISTKLSTSTLMSANVSVTDGTSSAHSHDDSAYVKRYFSMKSTRSPFEIFKSEKVTADDIFELEPEYDHPSEESDDEPEELKKVYVDDSPMSSEYSLMSENSTRPKVDDTKTSSAIVTNTALSVLRHWGQYLQICRYLNQISLEVIMLMSQMFDYYFYTVHEFFTVDLSVSSSTLYSSKLHGILKRIRSNIPLNGASEATEENTKLLPVGNPEMSPHLKFVEEESLHGLAERIVAVESVVFLAKQFEYLHPYLETVVAPHQRIVIDTFRDNTLAGAVDLRRPVYMCSACKLLDTRSILIAMSQVKWDVRDVAAQHSAYVDQLVRHLQIFAIRLEQIGEKVVLNWRAKAEVWSMVAKFVIHLLVEGFSNASKCSNGGRGLMQLDYTQLLLKLEKISGLKPVPYQEYVERYVKAFYLQRSSLEDFIKEHGEYSNKHLLALVNCACSDSKRDRQELASLIETRDHIA